MRLILEGHLETFLNITQPGPPNGLLTHIQHVFDFRIGLTFICLEQYMRPLNDDRFVPTFGNNGKKFLALCGGKMNFMFLVRHALILSHPTFLSS